MSYISQDTQEDRLVLGTPTRTPRVRVYGFGQYDVRKTPHPLLYTS